MILFLHPVPHHHQSLSLSLTSLYHSCFAFAFSFFRIEIVEQNRKLCLKVKSKIYIVQKRGGSLTHLLCILHTYTHTDRHRCCGAQKQLKCKWSYSLSLPLRTWWAIGGRHFYIGLLLVLSQLLLLLLLSKLTSLMMLPPTQVETGDSF